VPRKLISLIIPTRDRAESLRETLRAIGEAAVPSDLDVEVLIIDNGSADRTRAVVRQARLWGQSPRYVYEPRPGAAMARNAGLAEAQGEVLLWTDDDVRPGPDWIESMCRPILARRADAMAGRIKLPGYLDHPWLQAWHRVCVAAEAPTRGGFNLIGANMAFARRVLAKVPAFDTELGPGGIGSSDDTLFSLQLRAAGFRIAVAEEPSTVEHHCGAERLTRSALTDVLKGQGRSQAYIDYHWAHRRVLLPTLHGGKSLLGLSAVRMLQRLLGDRSSVIGRREARWLWRWSYYEQMAIELRRPRRYEQFGLTPLAGSHAFAHCLASPCTPGEGQGARVFGTRVRLPSSIPSSRLHSRS
jgi:glucosyl-dolichyl phosphate glucuronosyltransferase